MLIPFLFGSLNNISLENLTEGPEPESGPDPTSDSDNPSLSGKEENKAMSTEKLDLSKIDLSNIDRDQMKVILDAIHRVMDLTGFRKECIKVDKVYNSCRIAKCPVLPRPVVPVSPAADAFLNCEIVPGSTSATGVIAGRDRVVVTFTAQVVVTYLDTAGNQVTTAPTTIRHTQTIALTGAIPNIGMEVQIEPNGGIIECLDGRVIRGGSAIELDIGICAVVKIHLLVQLEVLGRFCPLPDTCEVLPSPCTQFLERCEMLELFPPQPEIPPLNNHSG